jgi:uncharacterized membrane protein
MSRIEFMRELESLLSDIPIDERNEALQYYNGYFEDAGAEHEEEILKELVSPARVAGIIKADLNLNNEGHENRGYFTEKGFQDTVYTDEKYEIVKTAKPVKGESSTGSNYKQESAGQGFSGNGNGAFNQQSGTNGTGNGNSAGANQKQSNNTNIALLVLLAVFAIPIGIPIFFSIFGVVIGVLAAIFGIVIGFGAAGVAMIAAGIALFGMGIVQVHVPFALLVMSGSGLLVFGIGVLFLLSSVMLCKKLLPAVIRGFVELCRLPFKNRSVTA